MELEHEKGRPEWAAAAAEVSVMLGERAANSDGFYRHALSEAYDAIRGAAESGQRLESANPWAKLDWDEAQAAVLTYAAYEQDGDLAAAALRALKQPQHAWQAAAWLGRQGVVVPEYVYTEVLVRHEESVTPSQQLGIALAKLDMRLQAEDHQAVAEALNEVHYVLSNREAFPDRVRGTQYLAVARTLRDGGWLRAAAEVAARDEVQSLGRNVAGPYEASLEVLRGSKLTRRFQADPRPVRYVPRRLTFGEGIDDEARFAEPADITRGRGHLGEPGVEVQYGGFRPSMVNDMELLLRAGDTTKAYLCMYELSAAQYNNLYQHGPADMLQALALMHVYQAPIMAAHTAGELPTHIAELRRSLTFTAHHDEVQRGNARVDGAATLTRLCQAALSLAHPAERVGALVELQRIALENGILHDKKGMTPAFLHAVVRDEYAVWRHIRPKDPARHELDAAYRSGDIAAWCQHTGRMCVQSCGIQVCYKESAAARQRDLFEDVIVHLSAVVSNPFNGYNR